MSVKLSLTATLGARNGAIVPLKAYKITSSPWIAPTAISLLIILLNNRVNFNYVSYECKQMLHLLPACLLACLWMLGIETGRTLTEGIWMGRGGGYQRHGQNLCFCVLGQNWFIKPCRYARGHHSSKVICLSLPVREGFTLVPLLFPSIFLSLWYHITNSRHTWMGARTKWSTIHSRPVSVKTLITESQWSGPDWN